MVYDLAVLAVAVGFLQRARAIDRFEIILLGFACLEIVARVLLNIPMGLLAAMVVAFMIIRRLDYSLSAAPALVKAPE